MSLEPQAASEPVRDDLAAARYWLDRAADALPPEVFDDSNPDHVHIAATLGYGYSHLAHYERQALWREEELVRIAKVHEEDAAMLADRNQREQEMVDLVANWRAQQQAAQAVTRPEYELRGADGVDLLRDRFDDISDAEFAQECNPGSRIFRREVVTTEARSEWTEVTA